MAQEANGINGTLYNIACVDRGIHPSPHWLTLTEALGYHDHEQSFLPYALEMIHPASWSSDLLKISSLRIGLLSVETPLFGLRTYWSHSCPFYLPTVSRTMQSITTRGQYLYIDFIIPSAPSPTSSLRHRPRMEHGALASLAHSPSPTGGDTKTPHIWSYIQGKYADNQLVLQIS